jgi:hypothetical protein
MTAQSAQEIDVDPAQRLPSPTSVYPLSDGHTMDDSFFDALNGERVPFHIPAYADISAQDQVFLWVNGKFAGAAGAMDTATGCTLTVSQKEFQFSGQCSVFYTVQDANTTDPGNRNISEQLVLKVVRSDHRNPYPGNYPAPTISPARYGQAQAAAKSSVQVTVAYPQMAATDRIQLYFDLIAATADKPDNYFYPLAQPIPPKNGSAGGSVQFALDASQFAGIDENIGHVYYWVLRQPKDDTDRYPQSQRADFDVDVVAPHN